MLGGGRGEKLKLNCTTNHSSVLSITVASVARATSAPQTTELRAPGSEPHAAPADCSSYCAATWRLAWLALFLISCRACCLSATFSSYLFFNFFLHFPDNFLLVLPLLLLFVCFQLLHNFLICCMTAKIESKSWRSLGMCILI